MSAVVYSLVPGDPNYSRLSHVLALRAEEQRRDDRVTSAYYRIMEERENAEDQAKVDAAAVAKETLAVNREILALARADRKAAKQPSNRLPGDPAAMNGEVAKLNAMNLGALAGQPVPSRLWIAPKLLSVGNATLFYAPPGIGKSLTAQQLMTSCATGALWFGLQVVRCCSVALMCEDDADELHRRQAAINTAIGVGFADLSDMRMIPRPGQNNILATFDRSNVMTATPLFYDLQAEALGFAARLVIIDNLMTVFAGNENDRSQVAQFMGLMNRLAIAINGAVLLLAHPSRSGMSADGDMDGGSTAWSAAARARWAMTLPKDAPRNSPDRVLSLRKSNYSRPGFEIRVIWQDGALLPPAVGGIAEAMEAVNRDLATEAKFLDLLDRVTAAGKHLSDSNRAANYAPKLLAKWPGGEGTSVPAFTRAMTRLLDARQIKLQAYGRPRDNTRRIARVQPAGEGSE